MESCSAAAALNVSAAIRRTLFPSDLSLYASLAMVVVLPTPSFWFVIVIIAREFIISGFRLVASDKGVVIAADKLGKVKTFL